MSDKRQPPPHHIEINVAFATQPVGVALIFAETLPYFMERPFLLAAGRYDLGDQRLTQCRVTDTYM